MSFDLFKKYFNKNYEQNILLKPKGHFTLWENDKKSENILVQDNNIVVNSYFDIISGVFIADPNKLIDRVQLGSGGVINSVLQTPTVLDTTLYTPVFTKINYDSYVVQSILEKSITYNFVIEKIEGNGSGGQIYSEAGLTSADGTLFARKTFKEIVKTPEKKFFIEWKLIWQ